MKQRENHKTTRNPKQYIRISYLFPLCIAIFYIVFSGFVAVVKGVGQDRQGIDLELEYFQVNQEKHLDISLSLLGENDPFSLEGVIVNLFHGEISESEKLGSITTNEQGKGRFRLNEEFDASTDSLYEFIFIARVERNDLIDYSETELTIRKSNLSVEPFIENDKTYVRANFLEKLETGEMNPVEWEELLFEVKRKFGLLPVEEFAFTDEQGQVLVEYPDDIPGDEDGNIVIVVRVEEHPDYGNVEIHNSLPWGVPLITDAGLEDMRTWFSRDPPLFFALIFWGSVIAAWGTIFIVIFNVFKIHKSSI
jgi:hypothetical protein